MSAIKLTEPSDIFRLDYNKIKKLEGWGELSINNLKKAIDKSQIVSLDKFIYSIGIRHIGKENAKILSSFFGSIKDFTKLFESKNKYESGSGWPSFFESLPGVFETKVDNIIGYPRTEYHCKECKGHHGHIFDDGPKPTGKRYCNNGLCLVFRPKK